MKIVLIFYCLFVFAQSKPQEGFEGTECKVLEKKSQTEKLCQFPFVYKNQTFYGCTTFDDPEGKRWCSTKVDPVSQQHISGARYFGNCPKTCISSDDVEKSVDELVTLQSNAIFGLRKADSNAIAECDCFNIGSCKWSRQSLRNLGKLDKRHPSRKTAVDFLRARVCNKEEQKLYCCNGEAPTELQLQELKKSQTPSTTPTPVSSNNSGQDSGRWKPDGDECGLSTTISNIFGGELTKVGEVTYMALLGYFVEARKRIEYACGGSIINKYYILTAAHCLNPASEPKEVRLGEWDVATDPDCPNVGSGCAPNVITRTDFKIIRHESYDFSNRLSSNDIGLLRLADPIPLFYEDSSISRIVPVCLPWKSRDPSIETDEDDALKIMVTGWGRVTNSPDEALKSLNEYQVSTRILNKVVLSVKTGQFCQSRNSRLVPATQFCALEPGKDSCAGDSGGPAVIRSTPDSPWYQVGIVSYGPNICGINFPGFYTKIEAFLPWIESKLE